MLATPDVERFRIGEIKKRSLGSGCTFRFDTGDDERGITVFHSDGNGRAALVNFDGEDVALTAENPDDDSDWGGEIGYESSVRFTGGGLIAGQGCVQVERNPSMADS